MNPLLLTFLAIYALRQRRVGEARTLESFRRLESSSTERVVPIATIQRVLNKIVRVHKRIPVTGRYDYATVALWGGVARRRHLDASIRRDPQYDRRLLESAIVNRNTWYRLGVEAGYYQ